MSNLRRPSRPMDELVDLTAACDVPLLVSRGTIYQVNRQRGETDFIAGCRAFHPRLALRSGAPLTPDQLHRFYDHGPADLFA